MIKIEWLKEKNNHKPGDIIEVEEDMSKHLISKGDAKLIVPQETEVNHSKAIKGIPIKDVTDNTDNIDNTDNTDNTDNKKVSVLSVVCDKEIRHSIFGDKSLDKILVILATNNKAFTYEELSTLLDRDEANVRQTINRNKEYFDQKTLKNRKCHTTLSQIAIKEINQRVSSYNQKKEESEKRVLQETKVIKKSEELLINFKKFFDLVKKNPKSFDKTKRIFYIDFMELAGLDLLLADELENNPEDTLRIFENALEEIGLVKYPRVRVYNLPKDKMVSIEQLRTNMVDKLISFSGRVVTLSDVRPHCVNARFECPSCGTLIKVLQLEKKFREPSRCSCGRRGGFKLLSKDMIDTARLILEDLQEKTDNPHAKRLNCFFKEDLLQHENMKLYESGNEIELVGILKEVPVPLSTGGLSTRFELAFESNSVRQMEEEVKVDNFTDEEVEEIINLSQKIDSDGLNVLNDSFAPEIYGHSYIKQAICLQLASRVNVVGKKEKKNKPNILLIGDPGTSKSKIGEFAVSITPGARRSVGGSASAVGLTGAVVRDDYTGGWRLEPGAAVLARDFFMIDELNNVKDEDKPRLQELLSEHTITFDKATIHAKLKALAGVLATANPSHGLFKSNEDLVKQFNLSPPIINRFDLIFVVKDVVDTKTDEMIAQKMNEREMNNLSVEYDAEFLKRFFVYIKEQPNPKITKEFSDKIKKIYARLRTFKTESLNINPRVHVAFLQLCKASAKIRLAEEVGEKDIERALELLSKSYFKIPEYKFFKDDLEK